MGPNFAHQRDLHWQAEAPDIEKIEQSSQAKIAHKWTPYNICEACEHILAHAHFTGKKRMG